MQRIRLKLQIWLEIHGRNGRSRQSHHTAPRIVQQLRGAGPTVQACAFFDEHDPLPSWCNAACSYTRRTFGYWHCVKRRVRFVRHYSSQPCLKQRDPTPCSQLQTRQNYRHSRGTFPPPLSMQGPQSSQKSSSRAPVETFHTACVGVQEHRFGARRCGINNVSRCGRTLMVRLSSSNLAEKRVLKHVPPLVSFSGALRPSFWEHLHKS